MLGDYYAHSLPGVAPRLWHRLEEHLAKVAGTAALFAAPFGSAEWAFNAGWLHDFGKAEDAFQAYLLRANGLDDSEYDSAAGRVNHSSAGAVLAEQVFGQAAGRTLAYVVAGHHVGLPDWYSAETGNAALPARLKTGNENLARLQVQTPAILNGLQPLGRPPSYVKSSNFHLWVRMLFSCLVDADFLDTELFANPVQSLQRAGHADLRKLKTAFDEYMTALAEAAPKTPVNDVRGQILSACRDAAQAGPGMFSLTAPTGAGKTLASVAFALDHAVAHKKSRIIYVIPYTSIIEQTAAALSSIFDPGNVVEHHSNVESTTLRGLLAAENWDAPVIVTTNVQFFESLYAASPSRCRKLHNVVNSVIILDEAQLLPPNLLAPCIDALNHLVKDFGVTLLLSTATQPALSSLPSPCQRLDPPREIVSDPITAFSSMRRTQVRLPGLSDPPETWESIAQELVLYSQVLCIVNTRRDCYDLFRLMPEGTIHLSALMCAAHRTAVIQRIKNRLRSGKETRVISTQLVEAGVDIDFPVVYRALAGLDSIAQAAGRCNREGRLAEVGQVKVFVPPKPAPRGLLAKGESVTRDLCSLPMVDVTQPSTFTRYFELFYARVNDTGSRFLDSLVKDAGSGKVDFRTAAAEFCYIDDQAQRSIFVLYGDGQLLIRELRYGGPNKSLMRRLQRFMVNLPVRLSEDMLTRGLLEEVQPGLFAQAFSSSYDDITGLRVYDLVFAAGDLMV